jgi:hypothetical protein
VLALAGASLAALEAAAAFLGGMSDLGFLIVLMRASLMDCRVCESWWKGCQGKLRKDVEIGRLVLVCGSFSVACGSPFT